MPGIKNLTKKNLLNFFSHLKTKKFDFLIVYFHFGYEFEKYPLPLHVSLSRMTIDLGADIVFGSHTHCIQPYEKYKNKFIFYGLGNFFFSQNRCLYPPISDDGLIIHLKEKNKRLFPFKIEKISFSRKNSLFKIVNDNYYLKKMKLNFDDINSYEKQYIEIRTRKKNPRPIMFSNNLIMNEIKYYSWLIIVKLTGYLKIRGLIKKMLGWN